MKYEPQPLWKGRTVVIIGGGPSLIGFPFHLLSDITTIGCNDAYALDAPIINMCLFCDSDWINKNIRKIPNNHFHERIMFASVNPSVLEWKLDWMHSFRKTATGFPTDGSISMNNSTGAAAIHVAWAMGAKGVYLLGFDCGFEREDQTRWHTLNPKPMKKSAGGSFLEGFDHMEAGRKVVAPDFKITNVVKNDGSRLNLFPKIELEDFIYKVVPEIMEEQNGVFEVSVSEADSNIVDQEQSV